MPTNPIVLTPDDIEREFKESKSSQAKRRMRGDGPPYIKRGNRVLTFREDYIEWLKSLARRSASDSSLA